MDKDLIFTAEEAAEKLKMSRSKLYVLLQSGELKSFQIGGLRRIALVDLEAFIERKRAEAALVAA